MYTLELTFTCRDVKLGNRCLMPKSFKKKDMENIIAVHAKELEERLIELLKSRAVWDHKGFLQEIAE